MFARRAHDDEHLLVSNGKVGFEDEAEAALRIACGIGDSIGTPQTDDQSVQRNFEIISSIQRLQRLSSSTSSSPSMVPEQTSLPYVHKFISTIVCQNLTICH